MFDHEEKAKRILERRDEYDKKKSIRRNRITRIAVIAAVLALTVVVSVFAAAASRARKPQNGPVPGKDTTAGSNGEEPASTGYNDGVIGERTSSEKGDIAYSYPSIADGDLYSSSKGEYRDSVSPSAGMTDVYEECEPSPIVPGADPSEYMPDTDIKAGMLTAGEWKDLENLDLWAEKIAGQSWKTVIDARKLNTANMVTVVVKDGDDACFNAAVELLSGENTLYSAKTDINGKAYLFYDIDGEGDQPDAVSVNGQKYELKDVVEVSAADAGIKAEKLDLMLMIDTTGSMGDELEYIKAELTDLVNRISSEDKALSIRISVNFYRDEGDDYIVKYYDFRTDVNDCLTQLSEQHANGGGDYPEAVHTALDNAVSGHQWRNDAVKLCFFVLDAPPHSEAEIQGINGQILNSLKKAAEQGIRIIPVASSGVDLETEIILRTFSVMTGGTYIFITNDSGIGGDHKEAEVGEHIVESLNDCMVRVACEYCGIYKGVEVPYTQTYHQ